MMEPTPLEIEALLDEIADAAVDYWMEEEENEFSDEPDAEEPAAEAEKFEEIDRGWRERDFI